MAQATKKEINKYVKSVRTEAGKRVNKNAKKMPVRLMADSANKIPRKAGESVYDWAKRVDKQTETTVRVAKDEVAKALNAAYRKGRTK
jgi:hypothetical protein